MHAENVQHLYAMHLQCSAYVHTIQIRSFIDFYHAYQWAT
jgi:hypothetical protein